MMALLQEGEYGPSRRLESIHRARYSERSRGGSFPASGAYTTSSRNQ